MMTLILQDSIKELLRLVGFMKFSDNILHIAHLQYKFVDSRKFQSIKESTTPGVELSGSPTINPITLHSKNKRYRQI